MKLINKLPLLALLSVLALTSCSTDNMDEELNNISTEVVIPQSKTIEIEILELINNHRISNGLSPLQAMGMIKSQTYNHTDYMIDQERVSHDNFYQRKNFLVSNIGATKVSENVAYGYSSAQTVVTAWLNSEGHRANIEGDFTNFEVTAEVNENGEWYYTNIFVKK